MTSINFRKKYQLFDNYERVKNKARNILGKYFEDPDLYFFNDIERSVTFTTERLIPPQLTKKPRVMLLFSNPHPHSVHQGMFLSPNSRGRENLFWPVMKDAGWFVLNVEKPSPRQLAEICLKLQYQGPFELVFCCYYAFPTKDPTHITKIFGKGYLEQEINPKAKEEFLSTVQDTSVEAVVTFNKGIFDFITKSRTDQYLNRLMDGELIRGQVLGLERDIPIFSTFPTGWRFHKNHRVLRKENLELIRKAIQIK